MNVYQIAVGDMNGDGIPVIVSSGNEVNVFLGNGDGSFQSPIGTTIVGNPGPIITGDFNGDGITDIAMCGGFDCSDRFFGPLSEKIIQFVVVEAVEM